MFSSEVCNFFLNKVPSRGWNCAIVPLKLSGGKVLIVMNTTRTCSGLGVKFNLASSKSAFSSLFCSFSRTILCRSQCDNCKKVIRFLGVRCQDCRFVEPWGFNQHWPDWKTTHCPWIVMCVQNTTDLTISLSLVFKCCSANENFQMFVRFKG